MRYLLALAATALLTAFAAACGGGDDAPQLPTPTPDLFDHNILAAIVLQEDEVGLPLDAQGFSTGEGGVTYTAIYGDDALRVQSTIARKPYVVQREQYFDSTRLAAVAFMKNEANYALEGTDRAFVYEGREAGVAQAGVLAERGDFVMFITLTSTDPNHTVDIVDEARRRNYAELVSDRIRLAIEQPGALKPPASAPTFGPN